MRYLTKIFALVLVLNSVVLATSENLALLDSLRSQSGWEDNEELDNGDMLQWKKIEGQSLKALRISREVDLPPEKIIEVLEDVNNYNEIIVSNSSMECQLVDKSEGYIDGYQYLRVPLLKNRDLIFRMFKSSNDSISDRIFSYWILLDEDNIHQDFLEDTRNGKSTVYLDSGAGIWTFEKFNNSPYKVSYSLYMNPGGWMPDFIINNVNQKGIAGLFDDVINEAERRLKGLNNG